jgi:hypothetical protein
MYYFLCILVLYRLACGLHIFSQNFWFTYVFFSTEYSLRVLVPPVSWGKAMFVIGSSFNFFYLFSHYILNLAIYFNAKIMLRIKIEDSLDEISQKTLLTEKMYISADYAIIRRYNRRYYHNVSPRAYAKILWIKIISVD